MLHPLDNPVWFSLLENHNPFAIEWDNAKFYPPDYCPFGAFLDTKSTEISLEKYGLLTNDFYILGEKPSYNSALILKTELACHQMILNRLMPFDVTETITELVSPKEKNALLELVNLVQPGYFNYKTTELGTYFGIFKDGILVSACGERMKMKDFTEVSAVVTHPNHVGKSYAKNLVSHTCKKIISENKTPFLHVAQKKHQSSVTLPITRF